MLNASRAVLGRLDERLLAHPQLAAQLRVFGLLALLVLLFVGLEHIVDEGVPRVEIRLVSRDVPIEVPVERVVERIVYVPVERAQAAPGAGASASAVASLAPNSRGDNWQTTGQPEQPAVADVVTDGAIAEDIAPSDAEAPAPEVAAAEAPSAPVASAPPVNTIPRTFVAPIYVYVAEPEEEAVAEEPQEAVAEAEEPADEGDAGGEEEVAIDATHIDIIGQEEHVARSMALAPKIQSPPPAQPAPAIEEAAAPADEGDGGDEAAVGDDGAGGDEAVAEDGPADESQEAIAEGEPQDEGIAEEEVAAAEPADDGDCCEDVQAAGPEDDAAADVAWGEPEDVQAYDDGGDASEEQAETDESLGSAANVDHPQS
jgi:hypothetical protein